MDKPYTDAMLRRFDLLTNKLSSRNQLSRIEARLDLVEFEKQHGTEACKAMFEVLKKRDAKRNSG